MLKVVERRENKLLERVEIDFKITHEGKPTPTRASITKMIASQEPGSKADLIVVKEVSTRFGQALTTGVGLVYANSEALAVEPSYVHKKLQSSGDVSTDEADSAPSETLDGGEE